MRKEGWSDPPFRRRLQLEACAIFYSLMSGGFRHAEGRPQTCTLGSSHQGQLDEK